MGKKLGLDIIILNFIACIKVEDFGILINYKYEERNFYIRIMKKERIIKINNVHLKNLRNNLRKILLEGWCQGALKSNSDDYQLVRDSICQCSSGRACPNAISPPGKYGRTDLDMGYIPFLKQWYCIDCFKWVKQNEDEIKKAI